MVEATRAGRVTVSKPQSLTPQLVAPPLGEPVEPTRNAICCTRGRLFEERVCLVHAGAGHRLAARASGCLQ